MMSNNRVEYDYDYNGDSLFIYCVNPYEYDVSLELDNDVVLDLDICGKPVAFEFLNASKVFGLDKSYFKNLVFDVNRITSNLNNVPEMETELVTA